MKRNNCLDEQDIDNYILEETSVTSENEENTTLTENLTSVYGKSANSMHEKITAEKNLNNLKKSRKDLKAKINRATRKKKNCNE